MRRLLKAAPDPPLQLIPIPRHKPDLERFRLRDHARRDGIAVDRVQDGPAVRIARLADVESKDQAGEDRVQLTVGEVCPGAHACSGAVAVVLGSGACFGDIQEAVGDEVHGGFEVGWVVVCGPHVLWKGSVVAC